MAQATHRDLKGYGLHPPDPEWPGQARIAISFVLNIEEGAELSIAMGDERNESVYEITQEIAGVPDIVMESHFEFGSRVGIWRILKLFEQYGITATMNVSARSFEYSPWLGPELVDRGHELCCHGYRWEHLAYKSESEERELIARTVQIIEDTAGVRPTGWHSRSPSTLRTRRLLVEHGGFVYDSDAYNDELPYSVLIDGHPHIILPYSFDTNDMRFTRSETYRLASDFSTYLIDSFDWLWQEGTITPKMMTIGLHNRIIGRPGRIRALRDFLDHITNRSHIWIARRDQIALHWQARMQRGDIPFLSG